MTDNNFCTDDTAGLTLQRQGHHLVMRGDGHTLFTLHKPLALLNGFTLCREGNALCYRTYGDGPTRLCELDSPVQAQAALDMTSTMLESLAQKRQQTFRRGLMIAAAIGLYIAGLATATLLQSSPDRQNPPPEFVMHAATQSLPPAFPPPVADAPPPQQQSQQPLQQSLPPATHPVLTPEQRQAAQHALATNLKNAAQKQLFTVALSTGHARTLYVFADPQCHNCRLFEPALQALSDSVNIEIFPVTLVGKDITAKSVVPVLCAPATTRPVLWRNLFDDGAGMLDLAHPAPALPDCKAGEIALMRNDRAFALYHLPGTPTVIADDGRPVPFVAMKNEIALSDFLNRGN